MKCWCAFWLCHLQWRQNKAMSAYVCPSIFHKDLEAARTCVKCLNVFICWKKKTTLSLKLTCSTGLQPAMWIPIKSSICWMKWVSPLMLWQKRRWIKTIRRDSLWKLYFWILKSGQTAVGIQLFNYKDRPEITPDGRDAFIMVNYSGQEAKSFFFFFF